MCVRNAEGAAAGAEAAEEEGAAERACDEVEVAAAAADNTGEVDEGSDSGGSCAARLSADTFVCANASCV